MEKKVTPEKKMELARHIREENLGNRLKLRQREHILYGKENSLPLYDKEFPAGAEGFPGYGNAENREGIPGNASIGWCFPYFYLWDFCSAIPETAKSCHTAQAMSMI